ncbi:MAG: glycine cleavage system protein H [Candidatus Bathyarchaeia archaeon]
MVELEGYNLPDSLYYTDRHLWIRKDPDGTVRIGFDDMGQKLLGKIMFIRLPKEGSLITSEKAFGTVESAKWVERLKAPVTGVVKEVNPALRTKPGLVNQDPYGEGWFIKVQPTGNLDEELANTVHGPAIAEWLKREIEERVKKGKKT